MAYRLLSSQWIIALLTVFIYPHQSVQALAVNNTRAEARIVAPLGRHAIRLNKGWRFKRWESNPDNLIYDIRPDVPVGQQPLLLKPWILPAANDFMSNSAKHYQRPADSANVNSVTYAQADFDDTTWENVSVPHDWAIQGPFYTGDNPTVGGGMGRLPSQGVGWYRRKLEAPLIGEGKTIYLDIDGAMAYPAVWLNGQLVGGWPYGYNSFRLDLTLYVRVNATNQLAIRVDNPNNSSRWYPGGGLYRDVWLTVVDPVHVAQYGTTITPRALSATSATLDMAVRVKNGANVDQQVGIQTSVFEVDTASGIPAKRAVEFPAANIKIVAGGTASVNTTAVLPNPSLWGPAPSQKANMYVALTRIMLGSEITDVYDTPFGVRSVTYDPTKGLLVNGEKIRIQGVNQHHDLGALGAAFNLRAAERQLERLQELGCNAIRTSHNPPARELLDLADRMGILVMDEIFDGWYAQKNPNDFHLIFEDWREADLRSFLRRDRNHPSVILWSFGNEVGEQTKDTNIGQELHDWMKEEDPTRSSTASMNAARPNMTFPRAPDVLSLNYQGEGIRDTPAYSHLKGTTTGPLYDAFHDAFAEKMILSSETAASLSTRGTYIFPVVNEISAPVNDNSGGNSAAMQVSAYELYSADFGSSPDKVFKAQDSHPFVAGEFVWSGWDYIGEPTPYYTARSSYFGIVDLAGFKKDRFFLYQSRWRPDLKIAHILPHWTWPDRVGQITPVHVFSNADEAELFVNGKSQGRLKQEPSTYRFRFDNVTYEAGEVSVVTYKNSTEWAKSSVKTAGAAAGLRATADRTEVFGDGDDLSFITVEVQDSAGNFVAPAANAITFAVSGPGELVATDNGNPADMTAFPFATRKAFSGLALGIVRANGPGRITVTTTSEGLESASVVLNAL